MRQVVFVQRVMPHYRHTFFQELNRRLNVFGVALKVIYGQEVPGTVPKTSDFKTPWAHRIENRYLTLPGLQMIWQPCLDHLKNSDLIIVEQANGLMLNHALMLSRGKNQRLAYFGHGKNFQARAGNRWRDGAKSYLAGRVDWWFAYTGLTATIVGASGYEPDRITVVQNAIDTDELEEAVHRLSSSGKKVREELNVVSDNICVYCGGMYPDKKLSFLLEACVRIRAAIPDFHMLFIGEGPDRYLIERAAKEHNWIHDLGPKYGADRVQYFLSSKALLMPGLVGLGIVDSFVTKTPLFTTDLPIHSPEIAYLTNQVDGVMTASDTQSYASAVVDYLKSPSRQAEMRDACAKSAKIYTLGNMVRNFSTGILQCLEQPRNVRKGALLWPL